jgi:hypothetical protein
MRTLSKIAASRTIPIRVRASANFHQRIDNSSRLEAVATIGIDIGKNMFYLVGFDRNGAIVLRQKLSRRQVEARLAANVGFKSVDA